MDTFLISAFEPLACDASKKNLDYRAVHGKEGSDFPPVDFSCLAGNFPVTLRSIDIFEPANANLSIGVNALHYETEFKEGMRSNNMGVIFPVRDPSIESVKH
jgi:hypothetical protein